MVILLIMKAINYLLGYYYVKCPSCEKYFYTTNKNYDTITICCSMGCLLDSANKKATQIQINKFTKYPKLISTIANLK